MARAIINGLECDNARATNPLFAGDNGEHLLGEAFRKVEKSERMKTHERCWRNYLNRHAIPNDWRGISDIYHYDRIVCNLTHIVVRVTSKRKSVRVQYAAWLRRHTKHAKSAQDAKAAMDWFHELEPGQRAWLAESYREDDCPNRPESRYVEKLNEKYANMLRP
jgi:hypothetical protein